MGEFGSAEMFGQLAQMMSMLNGGLENLNGGSENLNGGLENLNRGLENLDEDMQERMNTAIEMARMLRGLGEVHTTQSSTQGSHPEVERPSGGWAVGGMAPELGVIRSALPALEQRYRRPLDMILRIIEIQRMVELYGGSSTEGGRSGGRLALKKDMLEALAAGTEDEEVKLKLQTILKAIEVAQMLALVRAAQAKGLRTCV